MFAYKANRLFPTVVKNSLFCSHVRYREWIIDTVAKRGAMLKDMIANKDRRKHWHLEMMPTKPKVRVFEKIHRPYRRRAVLNSLFISNITDVISTGDILPDLANYAIEITGIQVSQCMKIVNVFWQVSPNKYETCDNIGQMLAIAAPKIRAELISRNVLGRVPRIFFLRDATNERVAEYELAVKKMKLEPEIDPEIVVDDSFITKMYSFKKAEITKTESPELTEVEDTKKAMPATPYKPTDMKCDTFGLDHKLLMEKVIAMKKKRKDPLQHTNVISPETLESADDLFSKIPGVCFQVGASDETESRDAILKKFRIERKMLKEKSKDKFDYHKHYENDDAKEDDIELNSVDDEVDDFIDEETKDNSR